MDATKLKLIAIALITLSSYAQPAKLRLSPADYQKWGTLSVESVAPRGNWVSCKMEYESGNDTLFLINAQTTRRYDFPKAVSAVFSQDGSRCVIKYPENVLSILELKTQRRVRYADVSRLDFISEGGYLLFIKSETKPNKLQCYNNQDKLLWEFENTQDYSIGKDGELAIITDGGVALIDLQKPFKSVDVLADTQSTFSRLTWSGSGKSLAFFSQSKRTPDSLRIALYSRPSKSLAFLDSHDVTFNGTSYNLEPYKLIIAEDDKTVYFNVTDMPSKQSSDSIVEIWDSTTTLEYPQQQFLADPSTHPYLAIWNSSSGTLHIPDSGDFTDTRILPNGRYAIAASRSSMVSRTTEFPPADYYAIDLRTGKSAMVARQCSTATGTIKASPSGRYLAWFKDGHYFVLDNETGGKRNVTSGINVSFKDAEFDDAGENPGYFIPGWTTDSKYLVVYDEFDIWLISPDGNSVKKITNGRKTGTSFRLQLQRADKTFDNGIQLSRETIDITKGVVLSATGKDYSSGYYLFTEREGLKQLCRGNYKTGNFNKAKNTGYYIYTQETHSQPPRLMMIDKAGNLPRMLYQSNGHYAKYAWSRSELITYCNTRGDTLKGVLMYPAGYQAGKKYPMVVYIYERLSKTLNDYTNPVAANQIGFSPPRYLHDGYFVLMPDIKYEIGLPGPSAVDCVTSAVKSILERDLIEENHIGLIGHSFGGFQAAFIITQTRIFAAAVASGAITDPVSSYLTRKPQRYRSENWRFEDHQYRMQSSPFNNWNGYIRNSTIAHAANIKTPLLSWHGKNDGSVNFEQGLELHLALRALNKTNIFLLYPGQQHVLFDRAAQLDLTVRIKAWFEKYLKEQ